MTIVIIALAVLLTISLWTILISFAPGALKIFRPLVCCRDEKMEITFSVASYHRPGEKSIEIYCGKSGNRRIVNGRTFLFAFLLTLVPMLPISAAIVILTGKLFFN